MLSVAAARPARAQVPGQAPSEPAPPAATIQADLARGFRLTSADGRQSLRLSPLLSTTVRWDKPDGQASAASAAVRLARLALLGELAGPTLGYFFQGEFAGDPHLLDLELRWTPIAPLTVRVGRVRVPVGRQWISGLNVMMLPDRSKVSDAFRPDRDTGITLESRLLSGALELRGGAYLEGADRWPKLAARLAWAPLGAAPYDEDMRRSAGPPAVALGLGGWWDRARVATPGGDPARTQGTAVGQVDLALGWGGFALQAEAHVGWREDAEGDYQRAWGAFAQTSLFLASGLVAPFARYNVLFDAWDAARGDRWHRGEVGLGVYPLGRALKLQARYAYERAHAPAGRWTDAHQADAQFVLFF